MKRCERLPFRWDARDVWVHRWHTLFCTECRRSRRADGTLARGAQAFQRTRRQAPLPPGLEAEILERLGLAVDNRAPFATHMSSGPSVETAARKAQSPPPRTEQLVGGGGLRAVPAAVSTDGSRRG